MICDYKPEFKIELRCKTHGKRKRKLDWALTNLEKLKPA